MGNTKSHRRGSSCPTYNEDGSLTSYKRNNEKYLCRDPMDDSEVSDKLQSSPLRDSHVESFYRESTDMYEEIRKLVTSPYIDIPEKYFPVLFRWIKEGNDVYISGTFSDWKKLRMVPGYDIFGLFVDLPEGDYEFKFEVDGQWYHDPDTPTVDNVFGTKNNVISVKKSECVLYYDDDSPKFSGSYSQDIPIFEEEVKFEHGSLLFCAYPDLFMKVELDKYVQTTCEKRGAFIIIPNCVFVNHLYTFPIIDNVIGLNSTLSYKGKSATILFYKTLKSAV